MKRICSLFLCLCLALTFCACQKNAGTEGTLTWQEQYDLGVRYLSEGNYEEAIFAFQAAIAIDPKRPEAYASLADAYLAEEDAESARDTLQQGVDATGDQALADRLNGLTDQTADPGQMLFTGPYMTLADVEFIGMTLEDASALALADGVYDAEDASIGLQTHDSLFSSFSIRLSDTEGYTVLNLHQHNGSAVVDGVEFHGWREEGVELNVPVHARGIHLGDSWEQVLEAVGFSQQEREIIGGPQDMMNVNLQPVDGALRWMVGFPDEETADGSGRIRFFYRDVEGVMTQLNLEFVGGRLNSFLVHTGLES